MIVIAIVYAYLLLDERRRLPTAALAALIVFLVAQLAYFRYRAFLSGILAVDIPAPALLYWLTPLGISFYTFEAISAAVDLHRRRQSVKLMTWSLFVMFLPHLVAGPIVRYRQLVPQFTGTKAWRSRNFGIGLHFFTIGFGKKLVADSLGQIIDPFWAAPSQSSGAALLLALIGFFCQLYLDFSGYTDMGRGIARTLGYRLPLNFRAPAFSVTPSEFYQRWHVSLSSWIRTFVYDTLAVAVLRRVRSRKLQNYALLLVILLVMAFFGLWHGSAWHYVLFGVTQGLVIIAWQGFDRGRPAKSSERARRELHAAATDLAFLAYSIPRRELAPDRIVYSRFAASKRLVSRRSALVFGCSRGDLACAIGRVFRALPSLGAQFVLSSRDIARHQRDHVGLRRRPGAQNSYRSRAYIDSRIEQHRFGRIHLFQVLSTMSPPREFSRSFSIEDQRAFVRLSGDSNPLHIDPVAARRLMFGQVAVHGIHILLWALDCMSAGSPNFGALAKLRVQFDAPLALGKRLDLSWDDSGGSLKARAHCVGETVLRLSASFGGEAPKSWQGRADLDPLECADPEIKQLATLRGSTRLALPPSWDQLFPSLSTGFSPFQAAVLLASTRIVGMMCPGLHSIFSGLSFQFDPQSGPIDSMTYTVTTIRPTREPARYRRAVRRHARYFARFQTAAPRITTRF